MQSRLDYIDFLLSNLEKKQTSELDSDLGKMLLAINLQHVFTSLK